MTDDEARKLGAASFRNRLAVRAARLCGCFYCLANFQGSEVHQWVDDGQTALCPHCRIDSVLPGVTNQDVLRSLHRLRFAQANATEAQRAERAASE